MENEFKDVDFEALQRKEEKIKEGLKEKKPFYQNNVEPHISEASGWNISELEKEEKHFPHASLYFCLFFFGIGIGGILGMIVGEG